MGNQNLRIVSLIPSATEIIAALGLENAIVGRSHECDYPPSVKDLPVCTAARLNSEAPSGEIHQNVNQILHSALSIYQVKIDVLEELKPTHIITQDQCDVCAVSLQDVEAAVAELTQSQPKIISLQPNSLADVWHDIERVASALGVRSLDLIEDLKARVNICQQKTSCLSLEELLTVACIEWTDPLMTAANWIPELVTQAGGQPLFSVSGQPSPILTWDTLVATNPDAIIFMLCGFGLHRTRQEAMALTEHSEWEKLHAVQHKRVYVTDGNAYFNRPGPRLVDSLEILAEILHPEIFAYGYKGTAWEPL
ncbi:cobalamin-binding protein [Gloeocapsopsis dulcis]|uniref:Cobalamin-binding protein n=1 Tax=Gloeocapsopsis dulcis AAB1 = 1H9 TaxID=1433147 RepID=A0A6N8G2M6_9CHRO|nr:cobalamin-binding protein [Gloeocapsopsis dulcis]MUL39122.1 cobalamin-binding protein [Gloeocapsopsis dulcis AAB1 = 1H9]WNN90904.1 cobalamin-binding protein [Gloeocapsopsis dulcis]